ncbi:MAG TPA: FHA domain-containing protein [Solirubrobacterales bacterium]|nr:FHA domain-containing protein [Solirubrobacterales bacterium]
MSDNTATGCRIERDAGRRPPIFDSVSSSPLDGTFGSGFTPGSGTYFCLSCGSQLSLRETDELPECPDCGAARFRRDSIFESMRDHSATTSEFAVPEELGPPAWLHEVRETLPRPGHYLAMHDDEEALLIHAIERGWTRIGRSATADLRLDDPTVSRRHVLIVAEPGKALRVLDDRSLNGVFVNGEAVEWASLRDGDELTVGRFRLYTLKA